MLADVSPPLPNLRRLRELAGLTQQQLAELVGVRVMTISEHERGVKNDVPLSVALRIAMALGVSVEDLTNEGEGT